MGKSVRHDARRRLGGWRRPPTRNGSRPRDRWSSCQRKAARYKSEASAWADADRLRREFGKHAHAYRCDFCEYWHVGGARRLQRFIERGQRERPVDAWMVDVIGARAFFCGEQESTGPAKVRMTAIYKRAWKAMIRSGRRPE